LRVHCDFQEKRSSIGGKKRRNDFATLIHINNVYPSVFYEVSLAHKIRQPVTTFHLVYLARMDGYESFIFSNMFYEEYIIRERHYGESRKWALNQKEEL